MPLIQKKSKKAFEENMKTEMEAGKPKAQSLAIAYSVKRKPKKMAQGGPVSAKTEKRPMPDEAHNDSMQESHNSGKKSLPESKWTDQPTLAQAQSKPKTGPIKHPRMVPSDAFSVRLRDEEDHLQSTAKPGSPGAPPPKMDDEMDAKKMGKDPNMAKPHTTRQAYAKGGMINEDVSMKDAEEDEVEHPAGLESDNDEMGDKDAMMDHFASGGNVDESTEELSSRPDKGWGAIIYKPGNGKNSDESDPMMAEGGEVDGGSEEEEDMHDSIAAAIMAKRDRKMMADGGQVDIDSNNEEQPNEYYDRNEAALKENYDSDMDDVSQPMDSNEHGDLHEEDEENLHDMVESIRRKIAVKRQFGAK